MPAQYEKIRDSYIKAGKPVAEAKKLAAMTYNSRHPGDPMSPRHEPKTSTASFDASAPKPLLDLYHKHYQQHRDEGIDHDAAHRRAIRMTQHAGWYKTSKGWKQIHPDLREKINVREAIKQPDGRYMIENVPVFYPNAVKGVGLPFSAAEIKQIMENTNRAASSGGPKTRLIEGHTNPLQKAIGFQVKSQGAGVNWRPYSGKSSVKNLAAVDLIDVEPQYVKYLQDQKLPGLSAEISWDANGLNKRFGYVAMLGGSAPALSYLPSTEVFSANYVCFSADPQPFHKGISQMLTDKQKACYAALHSAHEAYEAAEKSKEMGEPESDKKLDEAHGNLMGAYAAYNAEMAPQGPAGDTTGPTETPAQLDDANVSNAGAAPASNADNVPAFAADPVAAFNALQETVNGQNTQLQQLLKLNEALQTKNRALETKQQWTAFSAEVAELRKSGRPLPPDDLIKAEFEAAYETRDPGKALDLKLKSYKSLPPKSTPATVNDGRAIFSAEDANRAKPTNGKKPTPADLEGVMPKISEEDLKWAALGAAAYGDSSN